MTLRGAARRLGRTPDWVRGATAGMRINLVPVGRALVMTEKDFQKLRRATEETAASAN